MLEIGTIKIIKKICSHIIYIGQLLIKFSLLILFLTNIFFKLGF